MAGIPELIDDGQNGLLFTPSDWTELDVRIERLLGDEGLRARLVEQASQTIVNGYDITASATMFTSLFSTDARPTAVC